MTINVKSRWTAFAIHLGISIVVLLALLSVIFFVWFPYDLIFAGGVSGLKILMGVDLVLGPLLTLIVYKQFKPSLKMDLSIIALLQIGCLAAGLWLIYNERPLAQVLADDGVHLLAASDFKYYEIEPPTVGGSTPKKILLDVPEDRAKLGSIKFTSEFVEEKPFVFRDDLYLDMSELSESSFQSRIEFIQETVSEEQLRQLNELAVDSCQWVPLHSKHALGHACVNKDQGIIRLSEREF